jgi:hypothetical protein
MNLKSYLDLFELLGSDTSSREERRAFGLVNVVTKNKPVEQLSAWVRENNVKLKKPKLSDTFSSTLYSMTLVISVIAFIFGFLSGVGLLSYNGHEPVNVIYFIAMVVFLPLFTMTLTLFSMFRANATQSMLVHISPAFWIFILFLARLTHLKRTHTCIYSVIWEFVDDCVSWPTVCTVDKRIRVPTI